MSEDHDSSPSAPDSMPQLTRSPELRVQPADPSSEDPISRSIDLGKLVDLDEIDEQGDFWRRGLRPKDNFSDRLKALKPYGQTLGLEDLESCMTLEEASFPENQRCSRETMEYRLSTCGELCFGMFTSVTPDSRDHKAVTVATSNPAESSAPLRKRVLLAQIIATKTDTQHVKDNDMKAPSQWRQHPLKEAHLGHKEHGRTVAIHSLCVLPDYQNCGLGNTILKAYTQRISSSEIADHISLLTYERLVPFYTEHQFTDDGKSKVQYGGGNWIDMSFKVGPDTDEDYEEEEVEMDETVDPIAKYKNLHVRWRGQEDKESADD